MCVIIFVIEILSSLVLFGFLKLPLCWLDDAAALHKLILKHWLCSNTFRIITSWNFDQPLVWYIISSDKCQLALSLSLSEASPSVQNKLVTPVDHKPQTTNHKTPVDHKPQTTNHRGGQLWSTTNHKTPVDHKPQTTGEDNYTKPNQTVIKQS